MHSLSAISSHRKHAVMSSGHSRKLISSWSFPRPRTPPPTNRLPKFMCACSLERFSMAALVSGRTSNSHNRCLLRCQFGNSGMQNRWIRTTPVGAKDCNTFRSVSIFTCITNFCHTLKVVHQASQFLAGAWRSKQPKIYIYPVKYCCSSHFVFYRPRKVDPGKCSRSCLECTEKSVNQDTGTLFLGQRCRCSRSLVQSCQRLPILVNSTPNFRGMVLH